MEISLSKQIMRKVIIQKFNVKAYKLRRKPNLNAINIRKKTERNENETYRKMSNPKMMTILMITMKSALV